MTKIFIALFALLVLASCSNNGTIKQIKESNSPGTNSKDADSLPVIVGGYVPEYPISFSHSIHNQAGLNCTNCHRIPNTQIQKEPDVNDCVKCHNLGKVDYSGLTNHEQLEKACAIILN